MEKNNLEVAAQAGVKSADIPFVLCTHLHVDHVSWNSRLDNSH
ncbi:MBL fold metallo-hydrolase [Caballeronia sp. 15711]